MLIVVYGMKIDRLLDMLVEAAAQSEKGGRSFPLTIVFVERKVQLSMPLCNYITFHASPFFPLQLV